MRHLDDVLNLENQMKRAHLTLFIRLKNELTQQQQAKLYQLKEQMRRHGDRDSQSARQKRLDKSGG